MRTVLITLIGPERTSDLDGAVLVLRREVDVPAERVTAAVPRGEPLGSPLERTRELLQSHVSPGSRRVRFRPQLPEPGVVSEGRGQALEGAVAGARGSGGDAGARPLRDDRDPLAQWRRRQDHGVDPAR